MRSSLALQPSLLSEFSTDNFADVSGSSGGRSQSDRASFTTEPLRVPSFEPTLYAVTTRIAGRVNASSASPKERADLLAERQRLLDKKFDGTATRPDLNRLDYVRWSLDRIEDATYGQDLETLDNAVAAYERLLSDIQHLSDELNNRRVSRSRR